MTLTAHECPRSKTTEWLTPPWVLEALGAFDLDPCAAIEQPWSTAARHFTRAHNGLHREWSGRVWLNPPFGRQSEQFLRRLAFHGEGTAMIPARTETAIWFEVVWGVANAVCFMRGRPHFYRPSGEKARFNSGCPMALIAYGSGDESALRNADLGWVVDAKGYP